jgi:NTP pyrophosphatase (non-canonical NTP hydrolase)
MTTFDKIRQWGEDKGLIGENGKATIEGQMRKLQEEFDELRDAIIRMDFTEFQDAIGDMVVVLTLVADRRGCAIEDCIDGAYNVIKSRSGRMIDGVFVKDKS